MVKDDLIRRSDALALVRVHQRSYGGSELLVPFRAVSEEDLKTIPSITDEELMTEAKNLYAAVLEKRDAVKKIREYILNEFKVPEEARLGIIASLEEMERQHDP